MRSRFVPSQVGNRRDFLCRLGGGFASLALLDLLSRDGYFAGEAPGSPLAAKAPHFEAKAKRAVFLFMNGGPSHVDTFDPKPALTKFNGTPYQGDTPVGSNNRPVGHLMQSPFAFAQHGKSGLEISSLFPHTSKFADDLCVLRGLWTDTASHASGLLELNTGVVQIGKPSLGAWLCYGLGSLNENLPAFVVMTDPRGGLISGAPNWGAGFLPAAYQGTLFRTMGTPLLDLATPAGVSDQTQRRGLDLLADLNRQHLETHPADSELSARIDSYELAFRMQTSAAAVVDLAKEDRATQERYGLHQPLTRDFGRKCLITRRLLEKGVRFVQLYSGGGHLEDTWDGHSNCIANHRLHAGETDQPIAALMADLKRTGLWDETLLIWGGEFGRTPTSEGLGKPGRDHNPYGFSMWLAGAGVKSGQAIGATDELGFRAVEGRHHISDLHATILHLMGLDHKRLTFLRQGLDERLTGTRGQVIAEALV
jgi:uncharacterized protein (DUF1501 family)